MIFKQFYLESLGHASYLVGSEQTGEVLVLDVRRDVEVYFAEARAQGMRIRYAADTHQHNDYVNSLCELPAQGEAQLLAGGMQAWRTTAKELRFLPQWSVWNLQQQIKQDRNLIVLDVRQPQEWTSGHIPQAQHITGAELPARVAEVPKDRLVAVICGSGYRSSAAASLLQHHGHPRVINVLGGMTAWNNAKLETIKED